MNFMGVKHSVQLKYGMTLGQPRPVRVCVVCLCVVLNRATLQFYDEIFRPSHFLSFANEEDGADRNIVHENVADVDNEDVFE
jgi:hypothetical protein